MDESGDSAVPVIEDRLVERLGAEIVKFGTRRGSGTVTGHRCSRVNTMN
jgi:hypothetical protein